MSREELIKAIQEHARKTGLSPSTITGRAVNNSRLFARLQGGGDCTTEVAGKLRAYIAANSASKSPDRAAS